MDSRLCRDCGTDRPLSDFTRHRNSRDGYAFYCRQHARKRHQTSRDRRTGGPLQRYPRGLVVPEGSKWCPDCDTVKPLPELPRSRKASSGRYTYGKLCHNARGKATLEAVGGARTYHLKRRYGITAEEADVMLASQDGKCAICRTAPARHVDLDHDSGAVRALLCFNCNGGLGQFKDDPDVLRAAADYLRFHALSQHLVTAFEAAGTGPVRVMRLGEPPVGSQRRPEPHSMPTRSSGPSNGERRRRQAGEADT